MRVAGQRVVVTAVLVDVKGLGDALVVAELDRVVQKVLLLRLVRCGGGAAVEVKVDELRYRKVSQRLHSQPVGCRTPKRIEDVSPHPQQHLHARAAHADEQCRAKLLKFFFLARTGLVASGVYISHGVSP